VDSAAGLTAPMYRSWQNKSAVALNYMYTFYNNNNNNNLSAFPWHFHIHLDGIAEREIKGKK